MRTTRRIHAGLPILLAGFAQGAFGAPLVGPTAPSTSGVPVGTATTVLVTSSITDPTIIPESVVLQRINANGSVTTLGTLRDDGLNGDVSFGDKVFSLRITVQEAAPTELRYRVSAAFRGVLRRSLSEPFSIFVQAANSPQQMLSQLATALASQNIEDALTYFPAKERSREKLQGLTPEMRAALAAGLRTATLLKSEGSTRIYSLRISKSDGTSATAKIGIAQAATGDWFVMFW